MQSFMPPGTWTAYQVPLRRIWTRRESPEFLRLSSGGHLALYESPGDLVVITHLLVKNRIGPWLRSWTAQELWESEIRLDMNRSSLTLMILIAPLRHYHLNILDFLSTLHHSLKVLSAMPKNHLRPQLPPGDLHTSMLQQLEDQIPKVFRVGGEENGGWGRIHFVSLWS